MTLDADATVLANALGDPSVAARVAGAVDLDTLSVLFPSQRGIGVRGRLAYRCRRPFPAQSAEYGSYRSGPFGRSGDPGRHRDRYAGGYRFSNGPRRRADFRFGRRKERFYEFRRLADAPHGRNGRYDACRLEEPAAADRFESRRRGPKRRGIARRRHDGRPPAGRRGRGALFRSFLVRLFLAEAAFGPKHFPHRTFCRAIPPYLCSVFPTMPG